MKPVFNDAAGQPVTEMLATLRRAGRSGFTEAAIWESALCALILALEPRCRTYRILEALPYEQTPLAREGLLNCFAHLGYYARSVPVSLDRLDPRVIPCLFIGQDGSPVVVTGQDEQGLKMYGAAGAGHLTPEQAAGMHGHLWVFSRYDEQRSALSRFRREGSGASWFGALLGRFKGIFVQIFVAGFMLNVIALSTPLYIMLVYDRVIAAGGVETLPMLVVGVAIATMFEHALRQIRSKGLSWLAARMDNLVSNRIFAHLIGLPPALIERASVSAQIARIKTFESVRDFFSGSMFLSVLELPFVVLALVAIWAVAGQLVAVPMAMVGAYCLLFAVIYRQVRVTIRLAARASSSRQQFTLDTFEKIRGIRAYGLGDVWESKFRDLSGREMMAHMRLNWLGMVAETLANALTLISAVVTVSYGVHLNWAGQMTTGALVATMILVWRVLTPFYSMCTMIPRLEQLRNAILQVNKLMDVDTEAMEARTAARLPRMLGRVNFARVDLQYEDTTDVIFRDVNFEARPGNVVAITGANGSGKSSLLKLIKGLYRPVAGAVSIDGFDIRQLDAPDLRRQIAYVPQQADFFHGSILSNLRLGNPLANKDDAVSALQLADAWDEVQTMPQGLDTVIGRQGDAYLSVTLGVKLSLARAYLHAAPVILIDELPNTILSGRAGRNLKDYIARTKARRTTIMVSYRTDYMQLADTIVTLRRGAAPLIGTRDEMLPTIQSSLEAA